MQLHVNTFNPSYLRAFSSLSLPGTATLDVSKVKVLSDLVAADSTVTNVTAVPAEWVEAKLALADVGVEAEDRITLEKAIIAAGRSEALQNAVPCMKYSYLMRQKYYVHKASNLRSKKCANLVTLLITLVTLLMSLLHSIAIKLFCTLLIYVK